MHLTGRRLKALKPAIFIPTLYFAEGLPYALVVITSVVFYKNLGESLPFIGKVTSMFYLAWVLKFAWAPMVDLVGNKKGWIVVAQVMLAILCVAFVPAIYSNQTVNLTLICFSLMALASATQDVAIDGYYLEVLTKEQQSYFVGVRGAVYKIAWLFGQGLLVTLVGLLAKHANMTVNHGWAVAFALCGVIFLASAILHYFGLPVSNRVPSAVESENKPSIQTFFIVFRTFFQQAKIGWIVLYILIFRLGDAFVIKMGPPFLMDEAAKGGLAYSNDVLGIVSSIGLGFLLLGGIVGGIVVSKYGLKRTLMPTAIIQNASILLYFFLAQFRPDFYVVATFNAFEQFGYGLGNAAYTVFLLSTVKSQYKAGHYAIATALMALGIMLPGFFSGDLAQALGYKTFFLVSFLAAIPGMITILLLPLEDK
jgi:PAT family beta-lactamase induction signal transducer AmpG